MVKFQTFLSTFTTPTPFPHDNDFDRQSLHPTPTGNYDTSGSRHEGIERDVDPMAENSTSRRFPPSNSFSFYPEDQPLSHNDDQSSTHSSHSINSGVMTSTSLEEDETERRRRRARGRRQADAMIGLQALSEGNASSLSLASSQASLTSNLFGINSSYAKRMEETGRLRRLQAQQSLAPVNSSEYLPPDVPEPSQPRNNTAQPLPSTSAGLSQAASGSPPPYTSTDTTSSIPTQTVPPEAGQTNADQQTLHPLPTVVPSLDARLAEVIGELEATKAAMAHAAAEHEEEKKTVLAQLALSENLSMDLKTRLSAAENVTLEMQTRLEHTQTALSALKLEKRGWQAKLDVMHHKAQRAEQKLRALDHLTRAKLDAREAAVTAHYIRRIQQRIDNSPSVEVIGAVNALNEEILQLANIFVENLERRTEPPNASSIERASFVLGEGMSTRMNAQAKDGQLGFHFLLTQVALEVFMTYWCSAIIDGHYPRQKSFKDLIIEISAGGSSVNRQVSQIHCGKPIQILHTHDQRAISTKFTEWVKDIIDDLAQILAVGGLKMRIQRASMFTDKVRGLVEIAYKIRAALAERDICGGLELCVIAPDTPFQPRWMEEAHEGQTPMSELESQPIAGTCEIGLQRQPFGRQSSSGTYKDLPLTVVMKPKVVVLSILDEV